MQKLRLMFRGWSRRREEEGRRKQEEFLRSNVKWAAEVSKPASAESTSPAGSTPDEKARPALRVDIEGLQVAYLDESGRITYYLDTETGEVVEVHDAVPPGDALRYRRVPRRQEGTEIDDRRGFIETLDPSPIRQELMKAVATSRFRSVLATDRAIERAWYKFRNARATEAIEKWVRGLG